MSMHILCISMCVHAYVDVCMCVVDCDLRACVYAYVCLSCTRTDFQTHRMVFMLTFVALFKGVYIKTYIYIYIHIRQHACIQHYHNTSVYTYVHMHIHAFTIPSARGHSWVRSSTTYMHIYVHICIHTFSTHRRISRGPHLHLHGLQGQLFL